MEWFPREEVVLLLAALAASGCLVLGVVDLIWPSARSRPARTSETPPAPRPSPPPTSPGLRPGTGGARPGPVAPARVVPAPPAAATTAAPAGVPRPATTPAATSAPSALSAGRNLLEGALADEVLDRRASRLQTAVRWLERAAEASPGDPAAGEVLARARAALWATYQEIALRRLATDIPWGATALARPTSLSASVGGGQAPAGPEPAGDPRGGAPAEETASRYSAG